MSIREGMVLSAHEVVLQTIFLKAFKSMSFSKLIHQIALQETHYSMFLILIW